MSDIVNAQIDFYKRLEAPVPLKRCHKCGEGKPHVEFHKAKASKDGLRPSCKPCTRAMAAEADNARRERANRVFDNAVQATKAQLRRRRVHRYLWLGGIVALVAVTGYTSGYMMRKAECRDWTNVAGVR